MRYYFRAAIAVVCVLSIQSAAIAQSSIDQAHATVNRLLNGAGVVMLFTSGRTLESAHARISNPHTGSRCVTMFDETKPHHPDVPADYRGQFSRDDDVKWSEVKTSRVSGDHYYYEQIRPATGRPFTYHFQFGSAGEAAEFAEAAAVLVKACAEGGTDDQQAAETVVHDPRGNSGSLAIDRKQGSRYGWAVDYKSSDAADNRALTECRRGGGSCQIVLRFTGGCGAYAADQARGSSVYGWGTARSRGEAESRAQSEARQRGGTNVITRVWGCNSVKAAAAAGATGASSAGSETGQASSGRTGTGLSEEVIRRNAEAQRAHQQLVDQYQQQIKANQQKISNAVAERRGVEEAHQRELAKARAAREQYERERQAYREEYKRVTGHYPDE